MRKVFCRDHAVLEPRCRRRARLVSAEPGRGRPVVGTSIAQLEPLFGLTKATQRLPDELKRPWPQIPWQQISGFRNILVHNYLGDIDPQTVLTVVQQHLPPLEVAIRAMLAADGK